MISRCILPTVIISIIFVQECDGLWYHFLSGQPSSEDKMIFMDETKSPDGTVQRFETRYNGTSCYKFGPIDLKMDITRPMTFKKFISTCHISDLSLVHKQSPKEPYQIVKVVTKNHYEMMDKSCSTDSGTYYVVLLQTKTPADETLLSVHNDLLQMGITILPKNDLTVCQDNPK
ncbi:uncharacterized protein LOC111114759 [Crassostrea virginica]